MTTDCFQDVQTHLFQETINGRAYQIQVSSQHPDRWRAHLVSLTGGPTATMPFYGATAAEAAQMLVDWLTRAHAVATPRK